jgi:hypothetical protein
MNVYEIVEASNDEMYYRIKAIAFFDEEEIALMRKKVDNINTLLAELTTEPSLEEKQAMFESEYLANTSYIFADWDRKNLITYDYKSNEINWEFIGYCIGKGWKV